MTSPSTFHYSPYLVDSAAKPRAWVRKAGQVISYGIPASASQLKKFEPSIEEPSQDEDRTPRAPLPTGSDPRPTEKR